jgi:hypothetical protein
MCRISALGSTLHLKQRFGSGYQLSVSVLPGGDGQHPSPAALEQRAVDVKAFFKVMAVIAARERYCIRCIVVCGTLGRALFWQKAQHQELIAALN